MMPSDLRTGGDRTRASGRHALVGFAAFVATGVAAVLIIHGVGEAGVREVVRWTARSSLCVFCLAFAGEGRAFGRRHRTGLLRALALSHGMHAVAVVALAVYLHGSNLMERSSPVTVLGGALAYVFIFWGAIRPASPVVSTGLFWVWVVFLVTYGPRALRAPMPFGLAVAMLAAAMLARLFSLSQARIAATRATMATPGGNAA